MPTLKLSLGGGGILGLLHIGVMTALNDNDIDIESMIGVSAGALFSSIYCAKCIQYNHNIEHVLSDMSSEVLNYDFTKLQDSNLFSKLFSYFANDPKTFGLYNGKVLYEWLLDMTDHLRFCDLDHNLIITATEMTTGKLVVFSKDTTPTLPIADAARASSSLQGYFKPFRIPTQVLYGAMYSNNDITGSLLTDVEIHALSEDGWIYLWDGGNLGNCRNDIMLNTKPVSNPTLGVSLTYRGTVSKFNITGIVMHTIDIMMMATEQIIDILSTCKDRDDIFIYPNLCGVETTQFDIDRDTKSRLIHSGYNSALTGLRKLHLI